MTENNQYLWLKQWLFYSLKELLSSQRRWQTSLESLSKVQPESPLVIGISGAQGSGKTTLATALQKLWLGQGVQADVISLDDYYLEPALRLQRARLWHPLFAERGVPGTHETSLLLSQLQAFRRHEPQQWRRYDKGRDYVAGYSEKTTARIVILEGWCVGLSALSEQALLEKPNLLETRQDPDARWRRQVNQQLAQEYQQIWLLLDQLIWLHAPDWQAVCRWRAWQEQTLQQQGLGKSPAELKDFMLYFERLTRQSWQQLPASADFILTLGQDHRLLKLIPDE